MTGLGRLDRTKAAAERHADLRAGAYNLVMRCAGITAGDRVAVVAEDPKLGWFDAIAPQAVADEARHAGADVSILPVGGPNDGMSASLIDTVAKADIAIFFARIGDQGRFDDHGSRTRRVVSYARTARALASEFGRRDHHRMLALKHAADRALAGRQRIEITCPLGTRLVGPGPAADTDLPDVTVRRFPMCVPAPVSARGFSGEVVLAGHLTPTGSRAYHPASVALSEPVIAEVEDGQIRRFRGAPGTVQRVEAHYATVASCFGIRPNIVHSWHAGIHSACTFDGSPDADPDLWSNSIFGSPRYLHFHTCGNYPPGEICWMIADPTITANGDAVWRDGKLALCGLTDCR